MLLIGLTGKARAGKDTVGQQLVTRHGFVAESFAGPLKRMLHAGLGLDPADFTNTRQKESSIMEYGVSYRHLAQTLGTEWGRRQVHPDLWTRIARYRIELHRLDNLSVVLTDVRFENEAAMIRDMGGTVVHVMSLRESGLDETAKAHVSEAGVKFNDNDLVVQNNGTLEELDAIVTSLYLTLLRASGAGAQ